MDHSLLIKVGDKPHMLVTVLKFVGPWLSWGDWQNVEMLNKAINKWCQSEDAAMSLFGLWQERTMSGHNLTYTSNRPTLTLTLILTLFLTLTQCTPQLM